MIKKEITTEDLLTFMQDNLVTKTDLDEKLANHKHEILDVMDRKFEHFEQRMDNRFNELDNKLDFKFNTLTDVLREKDIISKTEAKHLKTLKPMIVKTEA
ncbi:hypothetical protein HQ524_03010 [Candidatus Uhrbacteria bacterium]|nr:hypothetical protein [Candidatus Uhrbacteria bacterium]